MVQAQGFAGVVFDHQQHRQHAVFVRIVFAEGGARLLVGFEFLGRDRHVLARLAMRVGVDRARAKRDASVLVRAIRGGYTHHQQQLNDGRVLES